MALSKECTSYMQDVLSCPVCLELVKEPQTLMRCFHNYCKPCIHQLIQRQNNNPPGVRCPLCSTFSADGEIRSNHFINDLLGLHSKMKGTSNLVRRPCEQCPADQPPTEATYRCLDCRENLCDTCKLLHNRIKVLKTHRLLEVTEETELVLDKLVFCETHADETLKLFCNQCKDAICMMCQVVTHKPHDTVTIEHALESMVPEVHQDLGCLGLKLGDITKAIDDTVKEQSKSGKAFDKCTNSFKKKISERIKQLQRVEQQFEKEMKKERGSQMERFEETKSELVNLRTQLSNLEKVATTTVEKARHTTLIQQLLQGGVMERLRQVKSEDNVTHTLKVKLPTLQMNDKEWESLVTKGLCGRIQFNETTITVGRDSAGKGVGEAWARYWHGDYTQVFGKNLKQTLKIELPDYCHKVTIFDDKVWAPIRVKKVIHVYNKQGRLQDSIAIEGEPVCVEKSHTGEMLVCCHDTGLFQLDEAGKQAVLIHKGDYSDLCVLGNKVYAWDWRNMQIEEFVREVVGWRRQKVVKLRVINRFYRCPSPADSLLAAPSTGSEAGVEFFVGLCGLNRLVRVSAEGEQLSEYEGGSVEGEGRLSDPHVCGIDDRGHVLVADCGNHKYKVMDTHSEEWSTLLTCDGNVYDAKVEDGHTVWCSRHTGGKHVITKHQTA